MVSNETIKDRKPDAAEMTTVVLKPNQMEKPAAVEATKALNAIMTIQIDQSVAIEIGGPIKFIEVKKDVVTAEIPVVLNAFKPIEVTEKAII